MRGNQALLHGAGQNGSDLFAATDPLSNGGLLLLCAHFS